MTSAKLLNLAIAHQQAGRLDDAEAVYRKLLADDPADADAWHLLGTVAAARRHWDDAVAHIERALALSPANPIYSANLAETLRLAGKFAAAESTCRRGLQSNPSFAQLWNTLGCVLLARRQLIEAVTAFRRAVSCDPQHLMAMLNCGTTLYDLGELDQALAAYEAALALQPDFAAARLSRSIVELLRGRIPAAWEEYEWRLRCPPGDPAVVSPPSWQGETLAGRTYLLEPEQGAGDTLLFLRYAQLLKQHGATVCLGCPPEFSRLLTGHPWLDRIVVPGDSMPRFDVRCALPSLPWMFGTTLQTNPGEIPYIQAPTLDAAVQQRLGNHDRFRIGIAWQGNPQQQRDWLRSIPLTNFLSLRSVPGCQLYSLQVGYGREQLSGISGIVDLADLLSDFADTAAVLPHLDLIIACDSAVAHLAGAMGVDVWVPLAYVPDWRWLLERDDSLWFPSARLFRQRSFGDWHEVFLRIERAVVELVAGSRRR